MKTNQEDRLIDYLIVKYSIRGFSIVPVHPC